MYICIFVCIKQKVLNCVDILLKIKFTFQKITKMVTNTKYANMKSVKILKQFYFLIFNYKLWNNFFSDIWNYKFICNFLTRYSGLVI